MLWLAALGRAGRSRALPWLLTAAMGLRLISQLAGATGDWLQRYATVAFSPAGSLLLWAALTSLVVALVSDRANVGRRDDLHSSPPTVDPLPSTRSHAQHRRTVQIALSFIALLLVAERLSRRPIPTISAETPVGPVIVVHTLAIFASFACQAVLLSWAMVHLIHRGASIAASIAGRLITAAVICQALGTLSGALWATAAWGSFWSWDPIECVSLAGLIWLAELRLHRAEHLGRQLHFGLIVTSIYTFLGTVLVRSGVLASASRHAYLSSAVWPALLAALAGIVILARAAWSLIDAGGLLWHPGAVTVWGWCHWLGAVLMALQPAVRSLITVLLRASWALAVSAMALRLCFTVKLILRPMEKP